MPYFLNQCFEGGAFAHFFEDDEALKNWILSERLEMFFEGEELSKDKVKDLAGTGDIKDGEPENTALYLENYISILENRRKILNRNLK